MTAARTEVLSTGETAVLHARQWGAVTRGRRLSVGVGHRGPRAIELPARGTTVPIVDHVRVARVLTLAVVLGANLWTRRRP